MEDDGVLEAIGDNIVNPKGKCLLKLITRAATSYY